ncbi:hypothetical protein PRIC1_011947 [Phytophthora ramorum]
MLLLRCAPRLPLRAARRFSSSTPTPPSSSFYDELSQYVKRVVDRSHQFARYRDHRVFFPSNWTLNNYFQYAQLQLPSKTEIDAVDFLTGAKFACDRVIRSMHSPQLVSFAAGNGPKPSIAYDMEEMFDSTCYERQFLPRVRRLGVGASDLRLTELDFTGVYLDGVHCQRTTRGNLKAEEALRTVVKETMAEKHKMKQRPSVMEVVSDLSAIKEKLNKSKVNESEDDDDVVERLRLDALFYTVQTVETVSSKTAQKVAVKTEVKTTLCFESLVTEPDDVDWRVVRMDKLGRLLSRKEVN